MLMKKNRVMFFIASMILLLSFLVHVLQTLGFSMHDSHHELPLWQTILLSVLGKAFIAAPIVCLLTFHQCGDLSNFDAKSVCGGTGIRAAA
ncbi:hypothetical protein [Paenibacillus silvisoli]|uniref:hypothetical protein n=1 Tax=Paenibacillus silvisoli TaxID=3110539 RepID=UPI002806187C|nr:hypothetical protein [Paenibacillus silvisoli]